MEDINLETGEIKEVATPTMQNVYAPTIWNDVTLGKQAFKMAEFLSRSALIPQTYQGKPENCLIALDMANRTGLAPTTVMQNLNIIQGKPAWSSQMCISLVNMCGRFEPLDFVFVGEPGTLEYGCYAKAKRKSDGKELAGTTITLGMAKSEGWSTKAGSKWTTMADQMLMYRAGAFFARVYCPDVLMGLLTQDEVRDVWGDDKDDQRKKTVVISLND